MKYLQRLLILLTVSATVFSCQKEYSVENNGTNLSTTAQWSFSEGSNQFKGPIDTITVDTINNTSGNYTLLTINGHSTDKRDLISLQMFGAKLGVGTYKSPYNLFGYGRNGVVLYANNPTDVDSFTVVLTKYDSTGIAGTFSGKTYDTSKTVKRIVDGKFSWAFKATAPTTPVSTDSGQVVVWAKAGCGGGTSTSPISISIGNKTGTITQFYQTAPTTCDPAGSFNLKLPVGNYTIIAKCGSDSLSLPITILKNTCTKAEVELSGTAVSGDYFPLTKSSNWSYLYDGGASSDTAYTLNTGGSATALGNTYYLQTNDYGGGNKDSAYYRKSGDNYYQYMAAGSFTDTSGGNKITITAPAYDYKFLVDNLTAGSTFTSSVTGSATTSGITIPITFTFKSTVTAVGATVTIGGVTYNNVIKIKAVTSQTASGVSSDVEAVENWYAPGIGLIKFLDYYTDPTFTTADDIWNLTRAKVY